MHRIKGLCHFERDQKLIERLDLLISEWELAYPSINVIEQLKWAHAWLVTHPDRPKKKMMQFLNNWMRNAEQHRQERKTITMPQTKKFVEKPAPDEELMTAEDWAALKASLRRTA